MQSFQTKEVVYYRTEQVILVPFKVNYEKVPFVPIVQDQDVQFWTREVGEVKDFFNIIKGVQNASMEPVKQLNKDTISKELRERIKKNMEVMKGIESPLQVRRAPLVLGKLKLGFDTDDEVQDYVWRFLGINAITTITKKYIELLDSIIETSVDKTMVLAKFHEFLKGMLVRKYSLGYITRRSFVKEFLDSLVNAFRQFGTKISSLEKEVLNRAIIQTDQESDISEILHTEEFSFSMSELEGYILFWMQKYSGIMPEEISLMLNTGTIYIIFDYQKERLFGTFITEDKTTNLDMGAMRELARKSIDAGTLNENLINQ